LAETCVRALGFPRCTLRGGGNTRKKGKGERKKRIKKKKRRRKRRKEKKGKKKRELSKGLRASCELLCTKNRLIEVEKV
jgi:hypothetical protein